ncbi:GAF domain-containing protein [Nostoc sp. XA010]|uniref:GAF domain-containing protein n=1 Tax=Nostoc sp. XA010 TaxID=2780407 RepID=UPI001E60D8C5|nr:GAF domain-containing protein [Nostoc sp. XA010]
MPLLNQSKLVGVLYLENQLAAGAFTPERVSFLAGGCANGDATRMQVLKLLFLNNLSEAVLPADTKQSYDSN